MKPAEGFLRPMAVMGAASSRAFLPGGCGCGFSGDFSGRQRRWHTGGLEAGVGGRVTSDRGFPAVSATESDPTPDWFISTPPRDPGEGVEPLPALP